MWDDKPVKRPDFRTILEDLKILIIDLPVPSISARSFWRENFDESASDPTTLMVPNRESFPEGSDHIALNQSEFFSYNNVYSSDNNSNAPTAVSITTKQWWQK